MIKKKFNPNKKTKTVISAATAVVLVTGVGVALGELLINRNTGINNIDPSKHNLPTNIETVNWYNSLSPATNPKLENYRSIKATDVRTIITSTWIPIVNFPLPTDAKKAFTSDQCNYPTGFVPVYIICLDTNDWDGVQNVPHFLLMDANNNIIDCVAHYTTIDNDIIAVVVNESNWTTTAIQFDGTIN